MNSREKGKRGERQWRDELRANGYAARRGQQFCGSAESPDVVCDSLPWIHFEVKAVERLNIEEAMEQARRDCGIALAGGHHAECGVSGSTSPQPLSPRELIFTRKSYCGYRMVYHLRENFPGLADVVEPLQAQPK